MSFRTDQTRIDKTSRTPQGFLRVDGTLTRTGIFTYRDDAGKERREYRPPSAVFEASSQASFDNAPITVLHPTARRVTSENAKELTVGHVREPRKDGEHLDGSLIVTDAKTIGRIDRGELTALSCGYEIEYDPTPGVTPEGERYDGVQTRIVGNHVALLPPGQARGGPSCVLRLDSAGDEELISPRVKSLQMLTDDEIKALKNELAAANARADAADAALKAATSRADSLEGANRVLTAQVASDPAKFQAAVDARVALLSQARADGVEVKPGSSEKDLRLAIICKRTPAFRADGLSDDAIAGAFALITALPHPTLAQPVITDPSRVDANDADELETAQKAGTAAAHKLSEKK